MYSQRRKDADKTHGMRRENGKYFIGGKRVIIDNNSNLCVDGKRYKGTEGLWELIVKKEPEIDKIPQEDKDNYLDIIDKTNALHTVDNRWQKSR